MKIIIGFLVLFLFCLSVNGARSRIKDKQKICISKRELMDKIKGGWAGQTIGVAYGGPTEFQYNGTMIQDYIPLTWNKNSIAWYYDHFPGLFDDVYMDVTFVKVFERLGLSAPVDSFAMAFAKADYLLWHANQAARYNILQGIMPPASGHWTNNPHADDIDYQIEADYAGLMSPGMVNTATRISDLIGHIMCYGDGWYGGVYIGAMYSLAFVSQDIPWIVEEALKIIPRESVFHQCMASVIHSWKKNPKDWKKAWFEVERNWSSDLYCPDGVYVPFNIDAALNAAYVVIGLLYGEGDFTRTLNIATRCGQDSDCNPATAGGILGTIYGYQYIPAVFLEALHLVEKRELANTGMTLEEVYRASYTQALQVIEANNGKIDEKEVVINYQIPQTVPLEVSFDGIYPDKKESIQKSVGEIQVYDFEGVGIVIRGKVEGPENYIARLTFYIDGKLVETSALPVNYNTRKQEIFWAYQLPDGKHQLTFRWQNPEPETKIFLGDAIWYKMSPLKVQK